MFAKLTGKIDSFQEGTLILDVGGVGYLIAASRRSLSNVGQVGDVTSLLIETQVREDAISLFGFTDASEKEWFKLLTNVQGVGAKAGMAILSVCPPDQLIMAIASGDVALIKQADGVGPKLATRIVTELKDKAGNMTLGAGATQTTGQSKAQPSSLGEGAGDLDKDAVSALVNLGYGRADAFSAVMKAKEKSNDNNTLNDLIKIALKELN